MSTRPDSENDNPRARRVGRRRTTGRNCQINIKASQQVIDHLNKIADRRGWVLGEVLENALVALEAVESLDHLARQRTRV